MYICAMGEENCGGNEDSPPPDTSENVPINKESEGCDYCKNGMVGSCPECGKSHT